MTDTIPRPARISLVDALRGFALFGILLVHNIDHFDIGPLTESTPPFLATLDGWISTAIFFLFGGKAYAMFALLFGFSFYIQFRNADSKAIRFTGRFAWRMILLVGFGFFHVIFYSGEILSCYAVAGLVLIPFRNLCTKALVIIAALCMLEPWEVGKIIYALSNPGYVPVEHDWRFYAEAMRAATESDSFLEVARTNLTAGMANAHIFAWLSGRYFQTLSLFIIGLLLGRHSLFVESDRSRKFWTVTLAVAAVCFVPLYFLKENLHSLELAPGVAGPLGVMATMWSNFAFMAVLVSVFVLLWFCAPRARRVESMLAPFGRMSLTNYICSSIIGSVVYYRYGLGMFDRLGVTYSFLVGLAVFILLLSISRWWLPRYKKGPLESLWGKLTWIGSKRK